MQYEIIPKLIREAKKTKILLITKKHAGQYNVELANAYLKYFTHVVFVDENNFLSGFAEADELLEIIKPINRLDPNSGYGENANEFVNNINQWKLNPPIVNPRERNLYVMDGTSRKQVLDLMNQHHLRVLPVVSSLGLKYKGVIDYDSIIWQITSDLYKHTKISFPKK